MSQTIEVLDHGYVRLVNNLGSDLDIVNAARVSYDKEVQEFSDKDMSLLSFLIKEKHDSTLRHCVTTFEVYAPLMVARQWYKHAVSSTHLDDQLGWNESSRRYITEEPKFHLPTVWRSAPANSKQGSGAELSKLLSTRLTHRLEYHLQESLNIYNQALKAGVAPEQARLFLPAYAMFVRWRWTASLNALLHFLSLRKAHDAQSEIQAYATAVRELLQPYYPETMKAWEAHRE